MLVNFFHSANKYGSTDFDLCLGTKWKHRLNILYLDSLIPKQNQAWMIKPDLNIFTWAPVKIILHPFNIWATIEWYLVWYSAAHIADIYVNRDLLTGDIFQPFIWRALTAVLTARFVSGRFLPLGKKQVVTSAKRISAARIADTMWFDCNQCTTICARLLSPLGCVISRLLSISLACMEKQPIRHCQMVPLVAIEIRNPIG